MKSLLLSILSVGLFLQANAQIVIKEKKYPSLLWEITGKGIKKPSYLIGTMHVSSKLAFHLPDSFYFAIRNADVVALETNPETWQEDMDKYEFGTSYGNMNMYGGNFLTQPTDYLTISTLKFYKYDTKVERSLYSNPSAINNLLYRSYGERSSDFEEDTYLDMYIYQCGKKRGKKVAGVEDYGESMRLMAEAYSDAAKDKNKKQRSYGDLLEGFTPDKLQEAYRNGNLDLLDSINKFNSVSQAFDEKFLYRRNEIQAASIDSIIKSGSVLFVGVGAAHLPGPRGVIEMLRKQGYKLRPVKMGERDSREKEITDKIRVPVVFRTESADDGMYRVDIPGKFYKTNEDASVDQRQYADMANGSYYMVTRIMTNAWLWNHTEDRVLKTVDSLLYENIPGKIISKTNITRNGYKGYDILNRTRRGDLQRYHIYVTPFEVLLFKMSGNGDYVKEGDEANKFFGSIFLKEYGKKKDEMPTMWNAFTPAVGGFSVLLPHEPYTGNDGSWIFDAADKSTGTFYRVIRSDVHNYGFTEEDTFDLSLMDESFSASEFIDTQLYRKYITHKGYPALDARYKDKNGQFFVTRFIIRGPHYYTLVAHGPREIAAMNNFLNSFEIKPFTYGAATLKTDTTLYYTVNTPFFPESKKIKLEIPYTNYMGLGEDEGLGSEALQDGVYKSRIIANDSTGEKLFISFYKWPRYFYLKDSSAFEDNNEHRLAEDTTMFVRMRKKNILDNGMRIREAVLSDTGSSRAFWYKSFYRNGVGIRLSTQMDTLNGPSSFVKSFFDSYKPADTLQGVNPLTKKTNLFFEDLASTDTITRKRALNYISRIDLDSSDFPQLKKAIDNISWKEKNYLEVKGGLLARMGDIKTKAATDYLSRAYYAAGDTIQLQYIALENMLQQKTAYAYMQFKDIMTAEPPVLDFSEEDYNDRGYPDVAYPDESFGNYDNGSFMDELYDSLKLTKTILPDLLPLLNLQDYKSDIMQLLGTMADSNMVVAKDYEMYYTKFLIEAKQELKKQAIAEKQRAIEKAEESKKEKKESVVVDRYGGDGKDVGNADLSLYATLLLPFSDKYPAVMPLINQMLASSDKELKYYTMFQLINREMKYPDTLLQYFAGLNEYRYPLYLSLKERKKLQLFPSKFNNHLDLAKSKLLENAQYSKPDSVVYVDRLKASYKGKNGYVYFYKYKQNKNDLSWKIATVGLIPEKADEFEFDEPVNKVSLYYMPPGLRTNTGLDFTAFSGEKIKDDKPVLAQLQEQLKKLLYSKRQSAAKFFTEESETAPYPAVDY